MPAHIGGWHHLVIIVVSVVSVAVSQKHRFDNICDGRLMARASVAMHSSLIQVSLLSHFSFTLYKSLPPKSFAPTKKCMAKNLL